MSVSQTSPLFYLSQAGTSHAAAQLGIPAPPAFLPRTAIFLPAPPSSTTRAPPLSERRPRPRIFASAPSSALTSSLAAAGALPPRRARPPSELRLRTELHPLRPSSSSHARRSSASAPSSTCSTRAPPSSPAEAPPPPPCEASPSRRARMPPELRLSTPLRPSSSHGASFLHARAAVR